MIVPIVWLPFMKNDVTLEMLRMLNEELSAENANRLRTSQQQVNGSPNHPTANLIGSTLESPAEAAKLRSALVYFTSDTGRGHGSFYGHDGKPASDYWLAVVWAIAGLNWGGGKDIAKAWSMQCAKRYDDAGFEKAWYDYKPNHPNPVGIGSLYKRAKELGWQVPVVTAPTVSRFKLLGRNEIHAQPPLQWALKGVFPLCGVAAIYGPSASGKSFLATDLALSIADGTLWFGIRTRVAPVVYVALEGEAGYKNRVTAWEQQRGKPLPSNASFIMQSFRLTEPRDVADLANTLPQGCVVFIDTLNRASPTSDENSSKEMGEILEGAKKLQSVTNGLVVLVHHTGKDVSKGARGHSSLFATLDGAIDVERTVSGRNWSVAKSKDGNDGTKRPFKLEMHNLGVDSDGEAITSCTVESDSSQLFKTAAPSGKHQKAALRTVKTAIYASASSGHAGCRPTTRCIKVEDAISQLASTLTTIAANKRSNRARTLVSDLISGRHLETGLELDEGWLWLP